METSLGGGDCRAFPCTGYTGDLALVNQFQSKTIIMQAQKKKIRSIMIDSER